MRYTARYYNEEGALEEVAFYDAEDDREAVAKALSADPIADENVAGWTLHDDMGREVYPTDEDYDRAGRP